VMRSSNRPPLAVAGLDIGTTATKAAVFDDGAHVLGLSRREHPLLVDKPPRAEQDPEAMFDSALETLRESCAQTAASGAEIAAVSLSSSMHTFIGVDDSDRPITPVLTWADNRAARQAAALRDSPAAPDLYRRTGTPIHPMSPLTKLMWFREQERETFDSVRRWISIKELFVRRVLGEYLVDHAIASATGLLDIHRRDWDDTALSLAGLDRGRLSTPASTTVTAGRLTREWADRLGLAAGTPVILGASDGVSENLGAAAIAPGVAAMTIGTSGAIRACVPAPAIDNGGRLFCYVVGDDRWIVGGPTNSGGIALAWLLSTVLSDLQQRNDAYKALDLLASEAPPGSEGVVFLPFLLGERAPQWDSDARAVFFGLAASHGRPQLIRAVMEGVVYQLYQVHRVLTDTVGEVAALRATGGFARSPVWRQICADVFGLEVSFPAVDVAAACRGAAMLGMTALGMLDSLEDAAGLVKYEHIHSPQEPARQRYFTGRELFAELYEKLRDAFREAAKIEAALEP
jgi:gluconokinase